jgi:aminodeoxyfutalosine synthase
VAELTITDATLKPIADKVLGGERLSFDDGVALFKSPDLLSVGWLANYVREKRHGNVTYYNVNRHINPTNICVAHCKLCAFGRDPNSPGAYAFTLDEMYERADKGVREGATEIHIVGGLHPDLPFDFFLELIRGIKQRHPHLHLKAFTMVEVHYFARIAKLTVEETLQKMKDAGVDS